MRRRDLLGRIGVGSVAVGALGAGDVRADATNGTRAGGTTRGAARSQETIGETFWDSTSSLLTTASEPITSDEHVLVRARESAVVTDEDGNGDAVSYGDTRPVLAARDGRVVGLGGMLVNDDTDFAYGNDEFLLNVWDAITDGGGTVAWDTGHDQYWVPDRFSTFLSRAEEVGYTVEGTDDLVGSLPDADLAVVTTPAVAFTDEELSALAEFRDAGGAVVVHDQSDFDNLDQTANVNALASALDLPFRFNDDQVTDESNNAGIFYQPTTDVYLGESAVFATREGVPPGPEFGFDEAYTATVEAVADGDTLTVRFEDDTTEEVRVLGIDTPEVPAAADAENPNEWEGIGDEQSGGEQDGEYPYLQSWAAEASSAAETLAGERVRLTFDEAEGIEDPFGRLLAFVQYDAGSGSPDRFWSRELVERGLARVYDSGNARHDALLEAELAARADGRGVWTESDPMESRTLRNEPVERLVFPTPTAVETFDGEVPDDRVAVRAPESASSPGAPLVAVDPEARVGVVGSVPVGDDFFGDEFPVDPTAFGNEPFLTALVDALSSRTASGDDETAPDVVWDGGHGQFDADAGLPVEGAATYQRYLEGVDLGLEQVNDYGSLLSRGRGLVITPGQSEFTSDELDAIRSFRDAGGSVVICGSGAISDEQRSYLNAALAALGSELTLDTGIVTDSDSPESVVTTTAFDDRFGLFDAFERDAATVAVSETTPTDGPTTTTVGGGVDTTAQTTTETPGFGTVAGVLGTVGGGLLAARRLLGDDAD